jgi:hypothetical protein
LNDEEQAAVLAYARSVVAACERDRRAFRERRLAAPLTAADRRAVDMQRRIERDHRVALARLRSAP